MDSDSSYEMIAASKTGLYNGRPFKMYAITIDDRIVGSISLYGQSESVASIGIEILPEKRRKGYATESFGLVLEEARERGYKVIQNQVRADNDASIALHEKIGFETDGYVFKNRKDHAVLLYILCLQGRKTGTTDDGIKR